MTARRGAAILMALALSPAAAARQWQVTDQGSLSLPRALERAAAGDTIWVRGGIHRGPLVVERSIRLLGEGWPVLEGGGKGTVVAIRAPEVVLRGFVIRNSGSSLDQENSGVAVEAAAARVEANRLEEVLFGIYLRQAPGAVVRGNRIRGKDLALGRRGDAIRVWYSDDVRIEDNEISASRDVVLWYSERLEVQGNRVRDGRYGLHFMYCDDATIRNNLLYRNSVGAFLMYSRRLRLLNNTVAGNHGPSGYGIGLKDMDDAVVRQNLFVGNRVGAFLDNSPREIASTSALQENFFASNDIGVLLLPNVRRARFSGNSFIENQEQVAVAGGGGRPEANAWNRNHWSDYVGYDADADGLGDVPYRAEQLFESLSDRHAELRLFLFSPASAALDFAARAFPVVRPAPKLVDPRPRMAAGAPAATPPLPATRRGGVLPMAASLVVAALALLAVPRLRWPAPETDAAAPVRSQREKRPLIEVCGLHKSFGDEVALDGVDFAVDEGEALALWGPNGAGKTTALRVLLGLVPFDGRVRVGGFDPARSPKQVRRLTGFVPQAIALQGEVEVWETLEFFARLRRTDVERVEGLAARLGLTDHGEKPVQSLSGGLKQRLALAVALLADPPILLLDEPTANLDVAARDAFLQLLQELKQEGKTLVFSSHRVDEVLVLADRVLHLEAGRLVRESAAEPSPVPWRREVELRLLVSDGDLARSVRLLEEDGFRVRRLGPFVVARMRQDRKVEALGRLLQQGIRIEDFDLEVDAGGGDGGGSA